MQATAMPRVASSPTSCTQALRQRRHEGEEAGGLVNTATNYSQMIFAHYTIIPTVMHTHAYNPLPAGSGPDPGPGPPCPPTPPTHIHKSTPTRT